MRATALACDGSRLGSRAGLMGVGALAAHEVIALQIEDWNGRHQTSQRSLMSFPKANLKAYSVARKWHLRLVRIFANIVV